MKLTAPTTLLITLSAHHYLSQALPLSIRPRGVDYLVVDVADPEVSAPDLAPGNGESAEGDAGEDVATRTATGELESAATTTRTPRLTPTESITGGFVPVVGVKETGGAVRSTAMVRPTAVPTSKLTPSSSSSSVTSSSVRKVTLPTTTSGSTTAALSEESPFSTSSIPDSDVWPNSHNKSTSPTTTSSSRRATSSSTLPTSSVPSSKVWPTWDPDNVSLPSVTSSLTTAVLSEDTSSSPSSVSSFDVWPVWVSHDAAIPTTSTSTTAISPEDFSFSPSSVSSSNVWPAQSSYDTTFRTVTPSLTTTDSSFESPLPTPTEAPWSPPLGVDDLDPEPQPTTSQTIWSTIPTSAAPGDEDDLLSTVSPITAPRPTSDPWAPHSDEPDYREPNDGGYPPWNGTVIHSFRPSE